MTPLVSVVIPTFNRADLVGQAIDSVLGQTLDDFEVVVVDDGSTDGTEEKIREYGDRVRFVRTPHRGIAHARNIGTSHARGRYLTFLDSDDLFYPYALELQTNLLERFPGVAFVCAEMSGFDNGGFFDRYHLTTYHSSAYRDPSITYERIFKNRIPLDAVGGIPSTLLEEDSSAITRYVYTGNVFETYLVNLVLCQNTVMLRREVAEEAGERNERVAYWEELDYLLRICRRHEVCFVDVPTYKLRYHDGQVSTTARADGKYVWMRKQQALLRIVKRHAFVDPGYYERRRTGIDTHLARLHRAVAVPMMLADSQCVGWRHYGQRSRAYLSWCGYYGQPEWGLWLLSYCPPPVRRFGVTIIERVRQAMRNGAQATRALAA
ncbi:MAG: glycosyltransferase [Acidobacteria bacterium]|nr:glycosyltransferase [Acidobacteriota bacterium]